MNVKLKASTILEAIIALVIIMIVFGLTMNFYLKYLKNNSQYNLLNTHFLMDKIIQQDIKQFKFTDEEFKLKGLIVHKTIIPYNEKNLSLIKYECADTNKNILLTRKRIAIKDEVVDGNEN